MWELSRARSGWMAGGLNFVMALVVFLIVWVRLA